MTSVRDRVAQILTLIPYLREHQGAAIHGVAEFLGCEPKVVLADLDAILMCGVPPYLPTDYVNVAIEGGRIYLQFAEQFRRPVRLTLFEAFALRVAVASLAGNRFELARRLLARIDDALPLPLRERNPSAHRQFHFSSLPRAMAQKLQQIEDAIEDTRKLRIEYYTAGRDAMSTRTVRPYGLVNHAGAWYLVAHCETRGRDIPFRVDRIKTLKRLRAGFRVPDDSDINQYRRAEMYAPSARDVQVEIRFSPGLARYIKEEHDPAAIRNEPDGSIVLTLSTHNLEWLVSWLLPYEDQAEVLAPAALRERMRRVCSEMAKLYR